MFIVFVINEDQPAWVELVEFIFWHENGIWIIKNDEVKGANAALNKFLLLNELICKFILLLEDNRLIWESV